MRKALDKGTIIRVSGGILYRIMSVPIGEGGGSIIYPVQRYLPDIENTYNKSSILYALKECYPVSSKYSFIRNSVGEVRPEKDDEEARLYLTRVKQMQLAENEVTGGVYQKGFRLTPVLETFQEIEISLDQGITFEKACNCISIMESLSEKGNSLKNCLKERKSLPAVQAFRIIEQVLYAVREVHDAGYLHLDLQDGNIFLKGMLDDSSSMISLIDFGSSRKRMEDGKCGTITDRVLYSTPGFSAPEMISGNDGTLRLGPEADIYSIGCLLLFLLTGHRFSVNELGSNKTGRYIPRFALRKTRCPKHLVDRMQSILAKSLENVPEKRYESAGEMLEAISDFVKALQPYRTDLASVPYDAFVCYKHGFIDSKAALILQQKLEAFRAPKGIGQMRRPFKRVFVDEGELSSCADFGEQIRDALKNAGWLIVVCSKETPGSPWVQSEIDTFLKYHDRSRVLAVLTEGEPAESFPSPLQGKSIGDGEVLAADARGSRPSDIFRKLRGDVLLKIAAPMLGTTYDTLKQRRKMYVLQQAAVLSSFALMLTLAFISYAITQNKRINAEYHNALINQSQYLAALAQEQLDNSNPLGAVEIALNALPSETQDRPVVPAAEHVLTQALNVYKTPEDAAFSAAVTGAFHHTNDIGYYEYFADFDSNCLFTCDGNHIYIWNIKTCSLVNTLSFDNRVKCYGKELLIEDKNLLVFSDLEHIYCYDYDAMEYQWIYDTDELDFIQGILVDPEKDTVIFITKKSIGEIALAEGKRRCIFSHLVTDDTISCSDIAINKNGNLLAFNVHDDIDRDEIQEGITYDYWYQNESNDYILIADLRNQNIKKVAPETGLISMIQFTDDDDILFVAERTYSLHYLNINGRQAISDQSQSLTLIRYDLDNEYVLWNREFSFGGLPSADFELEIITGDSGDTTLLSYANKVCQISLNEGTTIESWELSDQIISLWKPENVNGFHVVTRDGCFQQITFGKKDWLSQCLFQDNLKRFIFGSGYMFTQTDTGTFNNINAIIKYEFVYDENWHCISDDLTGLTFYNPTFYSDDGITIYFNDTALASAPDHIYLYFSEPNTLKDITLNFDTECSISIKEILGIYDIDGRKKLLLSAEDSLCKKQEHSAYCVIDIDIESLEQQIHYVPIPEEVLSDYVFDEKGAETVSKRIADIRKALHISSITYYGNHAYFTCDTTSADETASYANLFVYSWEIGSERVEKIASLQEKDRQNQIYSKISSICDIIVGTDEKSILIFTKVFENEEYICEVYHCNTDTGEIKFSQKFDHLLPEYEHGSAVSLIRQNGNGSMFSFVTSEAIFFYDDMGNLEYSIPYDSELVKIADISFIPDTEAILLLTTDGMLFKYYLESGLPACSIDLSSCVSLFSDSDNITWEYLENNRVALSDCSSRQGSFLIDIGDSTSGICTFVEDAVGYDVQSDRFYICETVDSDHSTMGYFKHYTIEELVQMGNDLLNK